MTDTLSTYKIINDIKPDEIYNLAAQSHVKVSFDVPEYTANVDALGSLRILEAIRASNLIKKTKYYQAGTSELFGKNKSYPQNEKTLFYPASPYGVAKLYAHWITINYRESYNIFACNGILFNHESPRRGETFVTKKIVNGLCSIKLGKKQILTVGNLYSKRDWGHASDYVNAMWLMMQQKKPEDYVISTGKQYSVKQFIDMTSKKLGIRINWKGKGIKEKGYDQNGKLIVTCSKKYLRPSEVENLLGDSSKARNKLKWKPKIGIKKLISEMIVEEFKFLNSEKN
jgi:GDPmannose 4,6-dehydratase